MTIKNLKDFSPSRSAGERHRQSPTGFYLLLTNHGPIAGTEMNCESGEREEAGGSISCLPFPKRTGHLNSTGIRWVLLQAGLPSPARDPLAPGRGGRGRITDLGDSLRQAPFWEMWVWLGSPTGLMG